MWDTSSSAVRAVLLVEGISDAAAVQSVATEWGLDARTFDVVAMGGVTNVGAYLTRIGLGTPQLMVAGLCDAGEERVVLRALQRAGSDVRTRADMERAGFFVCQRDLEDELLRALPLPVIESTLAELELLGAFRTFQQQPAWAGRAVRDQLRRFAGAGSGRKTLLARGLARKLNRTTTPQPLALLLARVDHHVRATRQKA